MKVQCSSCGFQVTIPQPQFDYMADLGRHPQCPSCPDHPRLEPVWYNDIPQIVAAVRGEV